VRIVGDSARVREFAVRLSLGATQGRLVWQLLWESFLLVLLDTVSGLVLARILGKFLIALPSIVPLSGSGQDNRVWAVGENRQSGFESQFQLYRQRLFQNARYTAPGRAGL
jgi:ABC-type antimicrobial peptide transport system permease subunit